MFEHELESIINHQETAYKSVLCLGKDSLHLLKRMSFFSLTQAGEHCQLSLQGEMGVLRDGI